jgi:hypothetical protein
MKSGGVPFPGTGLKNNCLIWDAAHLTELFMWYVLPRPFTEKVGLFPKKKKTMKR